MLKTGLPLFKKILLELQSNCNRDCFFCNRLGDHSGKRMAPNGQKVIRSMPTEHALRILDEAAALSFKGQVAFHHMSEPFLDPRIIEMAWKARELGMIPYEHTNGDVLRHNDELCRAAVKVFDHIVVGIYDVQSAEELENEKKFWRERLSGTRVGFSVVQGHIHPRTYIPGDSRMIIKKHTYPRGVCNRPLIRLIVHYDGNVALCCEDMTDNFGLGNAFEQSIADIWYSEKHMKIIQDLQKGRRGDYGFCSICSLPPYPDRKKQWVARIKRLFSFVRLMAPFKKGNP